MKKRTLTGAALAVAMMTMILPAGARADDGARPVQERVLVKFKAGSDEQGVAGKHGASVGKALGNGKSAWKVLSVPQGKAAEIAASLNKDGAVAAAEVDGIVSLPAAPSSAFLAPRAVAPEVMPNDPSFGSQWYLDNIDAPVAWEITKGSTNRTIAVIDTGVDLNHADLAAKIVPGYDYVNNDATAMDDQGHGTQMAGVAAAIGNNGTGIAGVDWYAKVMPVKVLDAMGSGTYSNSMNGIYYAADHGANVILLAFGGGAYSQAFQDAINYAWSKGAIIVAAVGSSNSSAKDYPAAYSNVISVTATDSSNNKASFASYGSHVKLAAPGTNILTTKLGGGTTTVSGTTYSASIVAGVATLAWSKNLNYANASVRDRLYNTADVISGTGTYWVYGKVNAYRAVNGF